MHRIHLPERPEIARRAEELGFHFQTVAGARYWDERGAYVFSLRQVEEDIEAPTQELHQMVLQLVDDIVGNETLLRRLAIPEAYWELVRESWVQGRPHLYGRMDFAYDGNGPAKLYELNYDTPTSLYEAAFFQWVWLEDQIAAGTLARGSDQFNAIQDTLIVRLGEIAAQQKTPLYLASVKDSIEDRGTVDYLRDCAVQAGIDARSIDVEDIGWDNIDFVDTDNRPIQWLFKLYPWEHLMEDDFGPHLLQAQALNLMEPAWKSIVSNKGILPLLWERYPNHPNLLEARFAVTGQTGPGWVRKPLFSREGANIRIMLPDGTSVVKDGPYDEDLAIEQRCHLLTRFEDAQGVGGYPLIGSWVVGNVACGMGIREDDGLITQDTARFVPHFIQKT